MKGIELREIVLTVKVTNKQWKKSYDPAVKLASHINTTPATNIPAKPCMKPSGIIAAALLGLVDVDVGSVGVVVHSIWHPAVAASMTQPAYTRRASEQAPQSHVAPNAEHSALLTSLQDELSSRALVASFRAPSVHAVQSEAWTCVNSLARQSTTPSSCDKHTLLAGSPPVGTLPSVDSVGGGTDDGAGAGAVGVLGTGTGAEETVGVMSEQPGKHPAWKVSQKQAS
jgi:hypothetical protein